MAKQTSRTDLKAGGTQDVAPIGDGKITYAITDKAPPRIALQRIEKGQTEIRLTEEQARAELLAGHIRPQAVAEQAPSNAD